MVDIHEWASRNIKTIHITQHVAHLRGDWIRYPIKVRRFVPRPGDSLARRWKVNGVEEYYDCAVYGIADMAETASVMEKVVDDSLLDAISFYIDEKDKLLRSTYMMAYRYSQSAQVCPHLCFSVRFAPSNATQRKEERDLLQAVLRLWGASRMESRSEYVCGEETLGMVPHQCHPNCPNNGKILTPPVFSAQMEIIMTARILLPMKKRILRLLRDLIHERQRQSWFTIYLTLFILLHSCAMLTAANIKRAQKQGIQVTHNPPGAMPGCVGCTDNHIRHQGGYFDEKLIEELHTGAKILLAYFHHCNKGNHPFSMDWESPDQMTLDEFTPEQVGFMRELSVELEEKGWCCPSVLPVSHSIFQSLTTPQRKHSRPSGRPATPNTSIIFFHRCMSMCGSLDLARLSLGFHQHGVGWQAISWRSVFGCGVVGFLTDHF